jgi:hypothetical protein
VSPNKVSLFALFGRAIFRKGTVLEHVLAQEGSSSLPGTAAHLLLQTSSLEKRCKKRGHFLSDFDPLKCLKDRTRTREVWE